MCRNSDNDNYEEESVLLSEYHKSFKSKKCHHASVGIALVIGIMIGLALFFGLYFGLPPRVVYSSSTPSFSTTIFTTPQPAHSRTFPNAAVAADAGACSTIGKDILLQGGSVVDSAIASMLCVGLYNCHSTGIGGGAFMTIYNSTTKQSLFINSREVAAINASKDMFQGSSERSELGTLAVAVPGEIAGFWEAHQRFGVLPWKDLFTPSIRAAQNGYVVSDALARAISSSADHIHDRRLNLWPIFENDDGSLKVEGDIVRRPLLARTLQIIADEGMDAFYTGSLAEDIIADLEDGYGDNIITMEDLQSYTVEIKDSLNVSIDDMTIFTPGPPASGPVMALILNILDGYDLTHADVSNESAKILTYHRIVEAFRFAYAKRSSLGDERGNPNITELALNMTADWYADAIRLKINDSTSFPVDYYEPEFDLPADHGTSHLSIVGANGDAVSITSTINLYFGSKVRGRRTGIIFNNEMDDFSSPNITNAFGIPPSPNNFIKPGNRPLSSMCPSVVVEFDRTRNNDFVRMVAGASGGSRITTSTSLTILNSLFFGFDAGTSVEMKRLHDQLIPNVTTIEEGFDEAVVYGLRAKAHDTEMAASAGSVVQAIVVNKDGTLDAASDSRKGGTPDGY